MSVGNQQIQYEYIADGNTVIFPFSCRVIYTSDIIVTVDGVQVNGYRVEGVDNTHGGNVVFNTPPMLNSRVIILRDIPLLRETDYQTNGDFLARTVNRDFDRIWMALQNIFSWFKRALKYPYNSSNYDAENRRIENLGHPANQKDATNKHYVDQGYGNLKHAIDTVSDNMIQGWITLESFEKGATVSLKNQALLCEADGQYYRWLGTLPINVNAKSSPKDDSRWVLIGDASLRSELSSPNGSACIGYKGSNLQTEIDNKGRLNYWIAQMAAGKTVRIACYGDSTTDGNATTGWTQNKFGTNHNDDAPNSWPVILQAILRKMYNNDNIHVYNAGYSGKRLDNGWAVQNFENAITNNPHYGNVDIVMFGFGINDAGYNRGDLLGDTLRQTHLLIDKIKRVGALPIILTCNVVRLKLTGDIDNKPVKIERINNMKRYIACTRNIPLFDLDAEMKKWMSNTNKYNYVELQPDNTHWKDLGHSFQACWIANFFYNRIVKINNINTYESIHFLDDRGNSPIGVNASSTTTSCKYGVNPYVNPQKFDCKNKVLLDIWVWCEHPNASIVYRKMLGDARSSDIKVTDMLTGVSESKKVGSMLGYDAYSAVDTPEYISDLKYGLNRIQLLGDGSLTDNVFFGHFDFIAGYQAKLTFKDLLKNYGTFREQRYLVAPADTPIIETSFCRTSDIYDKYGENVIQLFTRDKNTHIVIEGVFDNGSGVFLCQAPGRYKDTINGIMLYFSYGYISIYTHTFDTINNVNRYAKIDHLHIDKSDLQYSVNLTSFIDDRGYANVQIESEGSIATMSFDGTFPSSEPVTSGVAGNVYRRVDNGEAKTMRVEITRFECWYTDK